MKLTSKSAQAGVFAFSLAVPLAMGAALSLLHIPFSAEPSAISHFVGKTTPTVQGWKAVHLLSTDCPCSRAVGAYLLRRGTLSGVQEYVVLTGNDSSFAQNLIQAGFKVQSRSADRISREFQVPGAPLFILVSPEQKITYAGGYSTDRSARSGYQDQQILRSIVSGSVYSGLPVYGCALGKQLRKKIDPFGFKYRE